MAATEPTLPEQIEQGARTRSIVAVLASTGIVVSLAQTLVMPIIATLPQIFDTDASNTAWVITITLLVGAISTPVAGRLGDMFGKRKILIAAILPFIVGSSVCAVAHGVGTMIVGRGLQGLGSAMIPLAISLLHDVLPRDRAGAAIGLMSASMGIGGALGLPIAAAVAEYASWRVLFWATGAAALASLLAIVAVIPVRDPPVAASRRLRSFDWLGTIGLTVGLSAVLVAISKGADWQWTSARTLALLAVGLVVLPLWGCYEVSRAEPLVDLRTTVRPVILLTNIASILVGFAMYAMNLILPQVMEHPVELGYGLGQSMLGMGLWLAPSGVAMMLVSGVGARISRTRGPKVTLAVAGVVVAVGYATMAIVLGTIGDRDLGPADDSLVRATLAALTLGAVVVGGGVGLAYGSMPALIMSAVPADEKAAATGFNSLVRSLGTTASAAIVGVVLVQMRQDLGGHSVPTIGGFLVSLGIGGVAALVAAAVAAAIPGRPGLGSTAGV